MDESFDSPTKDNKDEKKIYLLKSIYEGRPSTIYFPYPKQCLKKRPMDRCVECTKFEKAKFDLSYTFNGNLYKVFTNYIYSL